jgi:acid phosphatase type 7
MEVTSRRGRVTLVLIAVAFVGRGPAPLVDESTAPRETLQAIGRRLSQSNSERALTVIASREDLILGTLTWHERTALAHGYLRFHVDVPVVVDVAVPTETIPFWIGDLRFQPTDLTLKNSDTSWLVYRKTFGVGVIGLGVNGLDRKPLTHYAVFVRPAHTTAAIPRQPVVELDTRQTSLWNIASARAGVSAAHDAYKPFESLPAELIDAILIQPAHAARHSALLATGRVWKTHVVSSSHPDQVVIGLGSDPGRELVWTWRTSAEVTSSALRIAPAPEGDRDNKSPGLFRVVNGESTPLEVTNLLNDAVTCRHRVYVDRLEPDTVYQYSLGDGTEGGWEPWQTVKTAPDSSRGARFVYLGDAQTGLEGWGRLLSAAYHQNPGIDFVLLAGDLVDRGNERTNWDHFFLRGAGVFDRVPLMPCVGNHEYLDLGPRLYRAFFELPRNGPQGIDTDLVYQFECGDACVVVLDSTLAVCDQALARRQAVWLDRALSHSKASWKVVMFHHPVYPSHPRRDSPAMREHWVPIFDKHHVDLVLQGHDHAYQRTYPLRGHRRVDRAGGAGTIYVIAVSGDKFVEQAARDYVEVGRSGISTYQTIEIDSRSNRLTYRARTEDGTIVDAFQLEKPRQPKTQNMPELSGRTPTIASTRTRQVLSPRLP